MIYLFRLLVDLLYVIAIFIGYCLGQSIGMQFMFTDMYIARVYCGFIGVAVIMFLFSKIKGTLMFFLKATGLYAAATNTSFGVAIKGTMHKLPSIIGVEAVTKLLSEAMADVQEAMTSGENGGIEEVLEFTKGLPFASVLGWLAGCYKKSFTYADECILAYSFALDKPISESIKDAFLQFLKTSHLIMKDLIMNTLVMIPINVIVGIICYFVYFGSFSISLHGIIATYIIFRVSMYILDDAIIAPFLLQRVIKTYVGCIPSASEQLEKDMDALLQEDDAAQDAANIANATSDAGIKTTMNDGTSETAEASGAYAALTKLMELPAVKRLLNYSGTGDLKSIVKGKVNTVAGSKHSAATANKGTNGTDTDMND